MTHVVTVGAKSSCYIRYRPRVYAADDGSLTNDHNIDRQVCVCVDHVSQLQSPLSVRGFIG